VSAEPGRERVIAGRYRLLSAPGEGGFLGLSPGAGVDVGLALTGLPGSARKFTRRGEPARVTRCS
jgi:hypothetical protein